MNRLMMACNDDQILIHICSAQPHRTDDDDQSGSSRSETGVHQPSSSHSSQNPIPSHASLPPSIDPSIRVRFPSPRTVPASDCMPSSRDEPSRLTTPTSSRGRVDVLKWMTAHTHTYPQVHTYGHIHTHLNVCIKDNLSETRFSSADPLCICIIKVLTSRRKLSTISDTFHRLTAIIILKLDCLLLIRTP